MKVLFVAAAFIVAAMPAAFAQGSFNPGTAIGNVYQNPASGCGYGAGYSGPGCPDLRDAPAPWRPHRVDHTTTHRAPGSER